MLIVLSFVSLKHVALITTINTCVAPSENVSSSMEDFQLSFSFCFVFFTRFGKNFLEKILTKFCAVLSLGNLP